MVPTYQTIKLGLRVQWSVKCCSCVVWGAPEGAVEILMKGKVLLLLTTRYSANAFQHLVNISYNPQTYEYVSSHVFSAVSETTICAN
jgi:hypothetical protein